MQTGGESQIKYGGIQPTFGGDVLSKKPLDTTIYH